MRRTFSFCNVFSPRSLPSSCSTNLRIYPRSHLVFHPFSVVILGSMRPVVPASGVNEPQPRDHDLSASVLSAVVGFPGLHYSMRSFGKLLCVLALGETCCQCIICTYTSWHRTRVCVGHKCESVRNNYGNCQSIALAGKEKP
jgi:hypothetical protein